MGRGRRLQGVAGRAHVESGAALGRARPAAEAGLRQGSEELEERRVVGGEQGDEVLLRQHPHQPRAGSGSHSGTR